jgi:hypothetical protein
MRRRWSDEAIVAAVAAECERRGSVPTYAEWPRASETVPSASTVAIRFGWNKALELAGVAPARPRRHASWSEPGVVEAFRRFHRRRGRWPLVKDLGHYGLPGPSSVTRVCGRLTRARELARAGA